MKVPAAARRLVFRPKRITTVVMMLIIWAGFTGALFAAFSTDWRNRDYLRGQAVTIADSTSIEDLRLLTGSEADQDSQAYDNIKDWLVQLRTSNPDIRMAYILGQRDDSAAVIADAGHPGSYVQTRPGQAYSAESSELKRVFGGGDALVRPYIDDRFGRWVAAYAPIRDPETNQVLAIVGIREAASAYYLRVLTNAIVPLLLAAIPIAGLFRDIKLEAKEREITALKNQFVSIASHELRSPITGLLWATQSLLRKGDNLTPAQKRMLTDMYNSTASSLATVNEILDLSVFERNQASKMQRETVDLVSVIREAAKTLKLGADEKKIRIVLAGEWPKYAFVSGDVAALKRSFMNLLANAIKYSEPESKIELRYKYRASTHIIDVKDHGIGIPKKEQAKVLGGYYRASNAVRLQSSGTGLGLWITRLVIEQHNGTLSLKSKPQKGTTVSVSLPAYHHVAASEAGQAQPSAVST